MDKRGVKSRVQANREKAFMSRVVRWAYERGKVKMNPCQGVKQFKEQAWTEHLHKAIQSAELLLLNAGMSSIYVLHQPSGLRYTRAAFKAQWMKAKKMAKEKYRDMDFQFTCHDLKAKSISDLSGSLNEKLEISGHKNVNQTARYNRKISIVPMIGGLYCNLTVTKSNGETMVK